MQVDSTKSIPTITYPSVRLMTPPTGECLIHRLPLEILLYSFSFLPNFEEQFRQKTILQRVCHFWKDAVNIEINKMSIIDLSKITPDNAVNAIKVINCKKLILLSIQEIDFDFSKLFQELHAQNITKLSIKSFSLGVEEFSPYLTSPEDLVLISKIFPNLKTLEMPTLIDTEICTAIQTHFPRKCGHS